jgi:hypothetical protein
MRSLGLRALVLGNRQAVVDTDPLEDENSVLVLDLTLGLDVVRAGLDFDPTRLQRARKGARESAGGRSDHVVERGRLGREPLRIDAVMLGHFGMHAEAQGLVGAGNVGQPLRPTKTLDSNA